MVYLVNYLEFYNDCAAEISAMYDYWASKRGGRSMPSPSDIDPIDIPKLLPGITLVDVTYEPLRFTYRLVGTRETRIRGYDPTGMLVVEGSVGGQVGLILEVYENIALTGQFAYFSEVNRIAENRWVPFETIYLPLGVDGRTVTRILVYAHVDL